MKGLVPATPAARTGAASLAFALALLAALVASSRHHPVLGTDGLIYHLALPAWWLQAGWLAPLDLAFHGSGNEVSPALSQTINLLLMRLTGDDGLVFLVQPLALVGLGLVYLRSARLLGASRALARGLAANLLLFPPLLVNARLPNTDLLFLLGAALALHGVLVARRRAPRGALLAGLGLGVALATKAIGTVLALVTGPLLLAALVAAWRRAPDAPARKRLALATAGGVALLLLGCAFLLRNWALFGNPLWPGKLRLLGVELPGQWDLGALVDHGWSLEVIASLVWDGPEQHAVVPPWSAVLWAGWALGALALAGRARRRVWLGAAVALGFAPLHFLVAFANIPFWGEPRYHLPTYYGLWLGLALGLAQLARRERRIARAAPFAPAAALLAWVVYSEVEWSWTLPALVAAGSAAALVGHPLVRRARRHLVPALAAAALVLLASGPAWWSGFRQARLEARQRMYPRYYGAQGHAWTLLDALPGRPTIAYAGTMLIHPLFGPDLDRRVVYLRLSPDDRETPIELGPRPPELIPGFWLHLRVAQERRKRVDDAFWLAQLEREEVDWLLLAAEPNRSGVAPELGLIARHPERFALRFHAPEGPENNVPVWLYEAQ